MQTINLSVEYAQQAIELNNRIPYGYVDKTVCGCGLTTLAIENQRDTIIAVPNFDLVDNKVDQYPNKKCGYQLFGVYGGVFTKDVEEYVSSVKGKQPIKIMVTYDSLWKLEFLFEQDIDLVIDESQELLQSLNLKLNDKTLEEEDVLTYLYRITEKYKERVSFISATPIPPKYLADFVSELPQVTINWSNTIEVKPYLLKRAQPISALRKELIEPILEKGYVTIEDITAKKLIIFVNSISAIKRIIKDADLKPRDVGYVVGKNLKNDVDFKKYTRVGAKTVLPKFTFITSTGFKGIDISDNSALNVVVSITTKEHTMVNMKTDLKQAISRQRNKQNPNYGKYIFLYNQTVFEESDDTVFAKINQVRTDIEEGIRVYNLVKENGLTRGLKTMMSDNSDFCHYTTYSKELDAYSLNEPAFKADEYFILEVRKQYKRGFRMQKAVGDNTVKVQKLIVENDCKFEDLVEYFRTQIAAITASDKSNELVDVKTLAALVDWNKYSKYKTWIALINKSVELYGKTWKNQSYTEEMIANFYNPDGKFRAKFCSNFSIGRRYSRAEIKQKLKEFYEVQNIKRTAKHTDLNEYFEIKEVKVNGERYVEVIRRK